MAREHIFRAWNPDTEHLYDNVAVGVKGKIGYRLGSNNYQYEGDSHVEINQYTGAEDSRDRQIFEGDILKIGTSKDLWTVEWDSSNYKYIMHSTVDEKETKDFGDWGRKKVQIVGNIYEDKDLLENGLNLDED